MIDGMRLRDLRNRHHLTAEQLGEVLGVTGQQVLRYESEINDMTTATLAKVCAYFAVSTDYLMGLSDQETYTTQALVKVRLTGERQAVETLRKMLCEIHKSRIVEQGTTRTTQGGRYDRSSSCYMSFLVDTEDH